MRNKLLILCLTGLLLVGALPRGEADRYVSEWTQIKYGEMVEFANHGVCPVSSVYIWVMQPLDDMVKDPWTEFDGLEFDVSCNAITVRNFFDAALAIQVIVE